MIYFRKILLLSLVLVWAGCETPIGQTWNRAVSRVSPPPEDDRDARYGIQPSAPSNQRRSVDSDTVYLGPQTSRARTSQPTGASGTVKLKPFRSSQTTVSAPKPTPKPAPKIAPSVFTAATSKPTPKAAPSPKPTRQTAPTPKLEKSEPSPVAEETPKATPQPSPEAPPPFASPVPGKKGYVTSPYSPDAGFIDVTGLDPGSLAKDPYSGKVFRVP